MLLELHATRLPPQRAFPLETICIFAGTTKITADMGNYVRFWTHRQLARNSFYHLEILYNQEFDYVDWEMVYKKLRKVPRLFQLWACKQVMGIAGTMEWDKTTIQKCPSCLSARNTCKHVLFCCHEERVETIIHTLNLMAEWLEEVETKPDLLDCIAECAQGRGGRTMTDICAGLSPRFKQMAAEQDAIGWRRFMGGMISRRMREIQYDYHHQERTLTNPEKWAQGLILKLIEATHGQWIYRNIQIHNEVSGTQNNVQKELIQHEIETQMELGEEGLLEEDHWMLEVNHGNLEASLGEQEEYWLLAIKAMRAAAMLTGQRDQSSQQMAG